MASTPSYTAVPPAPVHHHQNDEHIGPAFLLFGVLLTVQPLLLAVLAIGLVKYKRATRQLIHSRVRFHERAVLVGKIVTDCFCFCE